MAEATSETDAGSMRRNEAVLLGQGVSGGVANELTSVGLVLPFLYTTIGAPIFFAGLIVPLNTLAKRISQIFAARFVGTARSNTPIIELATLTMAASIVLIGLTFSAISPWWAVPIFLAVAAILGAAAGINGLAFQDLIGRALPKERRSRLLFIQSSIAGIIVVLVAYGAQQVLQPSTSLAAHQELIWLGVGLYVLAAVVVLAVREPPKTSMAVDTGSGGMVSELAGNFRIAFALPWFGKFLVARALYLSIELAIPFFSIHAATFHGDSISGLNTLVIAANIGIFLGGFLWARIGRHSVERIMVLASFLACGAGLMALGIEFGAVPPTLFCYALVFVAIALGAQGVKNGRTLYLLGRAKEHERPYCIAVANVTTGVVAVALGALLGALAGLKGVAWPIGALMVLNIAAAIYTLRLPKDTDTDPAGRGD
ncbi:hypothetical protein AUC70_13285 [Methyloceanibacter stevinii]|uniref:Major facilitator superfamily (MFS) profile domain-containing protein n=2 Tax=Methyloceanibacter stevinii TaxID=1774970 RepID=A0A1E3VUL9_9HYPH|nr:hypothetical protein AUC70_13285 [Methyloceanibacter stevinii]